MSDISNSSTLLYSSLQTFDNVEKLWEDELDTQVFQSGDLTAITFSFLQALPSYYTGEQESISSPVGMAFEPIGEDPAFADQALIDGINFALGRTEQSGFETLFTDVTNLIFPEIEQSHPDTVGAITFAQFDPAIMTSREDASGYVKMLAWNDTNILTTDDNNQVGDIWLSRGPDGGINDPAQGSAQFTVLLHEIGHALGLEHPYDTENDGKAESWPHLPAGEQTYQYSIMVGNGPQFSHSGVTGTEEGAHIYSLQLYDIAALQTIYGRNYSTRDGITTYKLGHGLGGTADATEETPFIYTIWDGGGYDTIDVSAYTNFGAVIDLRQGEFSSVGDNGAGGAAVDNLAVSFYTVIEEAIGTNKADILIGNAWDNTLRGGNGNDRIFGDGVTIAEDSIVNSIKNADAGFHEADPDRPGPEAALDDSGNDRLFGGEGNDHLYGGAGQDLLLGQGDNDYLYGGADNDELWGGEGIDHLYGGAGDDALFGGDGNDYLDGGDGIDLINPGAGADEIVLDPFDDGVDLIQGIEAEDTIIIQGVGSDQVVFTETQTGQMVIGLRGDDDTVEAFAVIENFSGASGERQGTLRFVDSNGNDLEDPQDFAVLPSNAFVGDDVMPITQEFLDFQQDLTGTRRVRDPLILDLDGNGYAGMVGADLYFDMGADNFAEEVNSWVAPGDGFLVWDQNGNDQADNGVELFGHSFDWAWHNLEVHDDNGDGTIDSNDAIWGELNVWQDKNADGFTQVDEWFELSDFGINSFVIPSTGILGTAETDTGSILVQAVSIRAATQNTRYTGDVEIAYDSLFLPEIRGFSTVPDLRIAMSLDETVMGQVQDLAAQSLTEIFSDFPSFESAFTTMMFHWAGVEDIAPSSRGEFLSDARILEFLENYVRVEFFQANFVDNTPLSRAALIIENVFESLQDSMMAKFIFQSGGQDLFISEGRYDLASDSIIFESGEAMLSGEALMELGAAGAEAADALSYWARVADFIDGVRGGLDDLTQAELNALNEAIYLSDPALTWDMAVAARTVEADVSITGTDANDFIAGGNGHDILDGAGGDDSLSGGGGHDHLIGGAGNDTLLDGSGSDLLEGGTGDDTYVWSRMGTNDFIFDAGGYDVLRVESPHALKFERVFGDDLMLRMGANTITLQDQLSDPALGLSVLEEIQDENGNTIYDLANLDVTITTRGTNGDDTLTGVEFGASRDDELYGEAGDDTLLGGEGDDYLDGGADNDALYGGQGNDELFGHLGNDYLDGGMGNDLLTGYYGNDHYFYTSGHDVVRDSPDGFRGGGLDVLELAEQYTIDDISFYRQYNGGYSGQYNLHIDIDDTNSIVLASQFDPRLAGRIETLRLNDGSGDIDLRTLQVTTYGSDKADNINGIKSGTGSVDDIIFAYGGDDTIGDNYGNDFIDAGTGNDTIILRYGQDTVIGGEGDDTVIFNSAHTPGTYISYDGGEGNDSITYTHSTPLKIDLAEGTITSLYSGQQVASLASIENATGGSGNDILLGDAGANILEGQRGNDQLKGGEGDDTYVFSSSSYSGHDIIFDTGGNDTLQLNGDYSLDTSSFSRIGDDLVITESSNSSITIVDHFAGHAIENLQTYYGTKLDLTNVLEWTWGTNGNDTIYGTPDADTIIGKRGADYIYGMEGDDTIVVSLDTDFVSGGDGNDKIYNDQSHSQNYVLQGDAGDDLISGRAEEMYGGTGNDTLTGYATFMSGGDGNDILEGGAQTMDGGAGDDVISGSSRNVDGGTGNDTITITGGSSGGYIRGGEGDDYMDVSGVYGGARVYGDAGSDTLTGVGTFYGGADNDLLIATQSNSAYHGNSGYDTIDYSNFSTSIEANLTTGKVIFSGADNEISGIEEFIATSFDDSLIGSGLADTFFAGDGNDTLQGLGGNDQLNGGLGSDVYSFSAGEGQDTIDDAGGRMDAISFDASVTLSDLTFTTIGDDLQIGFAGSADTITILSQNVEGDNRIELLQFADGTVLELYDLPVNIMPVAQDDNLEIYSGVEFTGNVLADNGNGADYDPDGDSLSVAAGIYVTENGGRVDIAEDGSFTYQSAEGFTGTDNFTYMLSDSRGGSDMGTVSLDVTPLPVNDPIARNDSFTNTMNEDLTGNLLADNGDGADFDLDGDVLSVAAVTMSTVRGGLVEIFGNGEFLYSPPAEFTGEDSFSYTLFDSRGGSDRASVVISMEVPNEAPEAADDNFDGVLDQSLTGNLLADNGNGVDSDPEGDALSVVSSTVTSAQGGLVFIGGNGDFTYTPADGFSGQDSFDYILLDSEGGADAGHVSINVIANRAPEAQDDQFMTDEDLDLVGNVITNDSDPDGDSLTVEAFTLTTATGGTVVMDASGSFTYSPAENFYGTDSFVYTITDPMGETDTATATIDILPVNDAPQALDDNFEGLEDNSISGNVLDDNGAGVDYDIDGDALSVIAGSFTTDQGGIVTISADGSFAYNPLQNFNGEDSVSYTLVDGAGGEDTGTLSFSVTAVNDAPVALDDSFEVLEDNLLAGDLLADNGQGTDYDVDGDQLSVQEAIITTAAGGTVQIFSDGTFDYIPDLNFFGTDSFDYTLSDGNGLFDTATATIEVLPVNDAPIATDDSFEAVVDLAMSGNVLTNDSDIENDPLSAIAGTYITANGSEIEMAADGSFVYTPEFGFYGTESFEYTVTDGQDSSTAIMTFTVDFLTTDVIGTDFNDTINGSNDPDRIFGLEGDDSLNGRAGIDWINGMGGNDEITGHLGADTLIGGDGDDIINGNGGDDIFYGGRGNDVLFGAAGFDTFVFEADKAFDGVDTIKNFGQQEGDALDISDLLSSYDPLGDILDDFVQISSGANNDSLLSVDIDGGGDNFVTIAILDGLPKVPDATTLLETGNLII